MAIAAYRFKPGDKTARGLLSLPAAEGMASKIRFGF
jgi:hypothetical protein